MPTEKPCRAFAWIGQTFRSCDDCGYPFWEHTHTYKLGSGRPFGSEPELVAIDAQSAAECKANWGHR